MRRHHIFIFLIGSIFAAFAILFVCFPRTAFSEIERRELARFPEITTEAVKSGDFTRDVAAWFSDTQPFRDRFLAFAMELKSRMALHLDEADEIAFHASSDAMMDDDDLDGGEPADRLDGDALSLDADSIEEYDGHATPAGAARMASSGVIVVGSDSNTRALMAFGGKPTGGTAYAEAANLYKSTLGPDVKVYCMVIPLASEFYTPAKAAKLTQPQLPVIRNIYSRLNPGVKAVDAYSTLAAHADEPIYLRTDHHWAPLGAYYAAEALAKTAGVPFLPIDSYDSHTIRDFVGTMYGFSKDISIKNAPEEFIYYTPRGVDYNTTFITIRLDKKFRPIGESKPFKANFFQRYPDGSSSAYLTFMGGDYNQTVVRTSTANGRRLVIIKDSYGNALPGFLFGSFEEIHVLDHRYFRHSVKDYVAENKITDLVMVNNTFNAYSSGVAKRYKYILTQATPVPDPILPAATTVSQLPKTSEPADTSTPAVTTEPDKVVAPTKSDSTTVTPPEEVASPVITPSDIPDTIPPITGFILEAHAGAPTSGTAVRNRS